jgi:hypothetical protein
LIAGIGLWAALTGSAHAGLMITALESGSDVVFSYSGSIDLTGAPGPVGGRGAAFINAGAPALSFQSFSSGQADFYSLPSPPPAFPGFGSGGPSAPSSTTGDILRLSGASNPHELTLPAGYTSNTALSGSMTFLGQSFASLGLTPGVYVWDLTFIDGPAQDATIRIGSAEVPAPGTFALLGLGLGGLRALRQKRKRAR